MFGSLVKEFLDSLVLYLHEIQLKLSILRKIFFCGGVIQTVRGNCYQEEAYIIITPYHLRKIFIFLRCFYTQVMMQLIQSRSNTLPPQYTIIMHGRISNNPSPIPFSSTVLAHPVRRHKPQPIFTYHPKEAPPNIYYDMNPYLLQLAPSEQPRRPFISKSRNSTQSKELSDRSSHRSLKVIRVNGLKEAEKPRIIKPFQQRSLHSSRGHEHGRRHHQREGELQNENRVLRAQQEALKERIRVFQSSKQEEMRILEEKIAQLIVKMMEVERKVEKGEEQWHIRASRLPNSIHGKT